MDKLMVDSRGKTTISNDGATIMNLLEVVHPAARTLVDIAKSQDAEVGDGTTSVVLLASEILKNCKQYVDEGSFEILFLSPINIFNFSPCIRCSSTNHRQVAAQGRSNVNQKDQ
jgi:hypothetical protein